LKVLNRAHPSVVGLFHYGPRGNVVLPYDPRIQHEIEISAGQELTAALRSKLGFAESGGAALGARSAAGRVPRLPELDGAVVDVELLRFPRAGASPAGRVIEIIGRPGELGVDTEIIIRKHHLPSEFPAEVLEAAEQRAVSVSDADREGRGDFRHLPM
jgi:ribonuclease R